LSQRTRARTTGETARKPPESAGTRAKRGETSAAKKEEEAGIALSPETLARTLRAVAAELERNPDLARRISGTISSDSSTPPPAAPAAERASTPVAHTFRPRLVAGASPDLGPGVPDPFLLWTQRGEKGLRAALEELRLGTLRAMIREHGLAPRGKVADERDAAKLRALILREVARAHV
jgi:hypothetical protein